MQQPGVRAVENASKVDQAKAAESASIENDENKIEHGTLKDEFSSDEYFVEKTTSTLDKEVCDLIKMNAVSKPGDHALANRIQNTHNKLEEGRSEGTPRED